MPTSLGQLDSVGSGWLLSASGGGGLSRAEEGWEHTALRRPASLPTGRGTVAGACQHMTGDGNGGPGLLGALCALPTGSQEGGCPLAWSYPAGLVVTQFLHTRVCTQPWGVPGG